MAKKNEQAAVVDEQNAAQNEQAAVVDEQNAAQNEQAAVVDSSVVSREVYDEQIQLRNEKISELEQQLNESLFVLQQAEEKIKAYEQGDENAAICDEENKALVKYEEIENINAGDEYLLRGNSDVTAKIEAIYPAGQSAQYPVNSAIILINGERCVLSQALIKECFIQKEEIPF